MAVTQDKLSSDRVRLGLSEPTINKVIAELNSILADAQVLYFMTRHCHWNVIDPRFIQLHKFFEEQYEELAEATDVLAEHIRSFGRFAPSSMKEYLRLTSLKEINQELSGDDMIEVLAQGHETCLQNLRKAIKKIEALGDVSTVDVLTDRIREHQKTAWMLRSHLGGHING
ncbi:MAG: DNA starvation/stationary phase protection protein [Chlamydiales bacterium]|nr:DNA starvation/stationary phase protection protein [Chlamydiales bacterium]